MDHQLWSKLPTELSEMVLSFLPVVNLCRFRIVCRRWNNLICSPEFGKLCVVNAARNANERACLVVNLKVEDLSCKEKSSGKSSGKRRWKSRWSVLDLREKNWYDLKPDLPWLELPWGSRVLDTDGGFVCSTVSNSMSKRPESLCVFNLFGGAVKMLPDPPSFDGVLYSVFNMTLKLMVNNNSNTFKVLLIILDKHYGGSFPFCIYESSADQWTTARTPPFVEVHTYGPLSIVVFQGLLYCCSEFGFSHGGMLWSFNFLDGSWEDTGVYFPNAGRTCHPRLDLVVIDNRLFVTNSFKEEGFDLLLEISEIFLKDKMTRTVVRTEFSAVFPIGPKGTNSRQCRAFGLNKSKLLLSTITGKVAMYDLVAGEWDWLPQNPLDDSDIVRKANWGQMDYFRLPNAPW